ncbi:hypothetical protein TNCV_2655791 [Trichonephila clavipes]|nr:hypothetical protein TNCV_2655791 [Trichonephila clavipes]
MGGSILELPQSFELSLPAEEDGAFCRSGRYVPDLWIGKKNALAAERLYRERYPQRDAPDQWIFTNLNNINELEL